MKIIGWLYLQIGVIILSILCCFALIYLFKEQEKTASLLSLICFVFFFSIFKISFYIIFSFEHLLKSLKKETFTKTKFLFIMFWILLLVQISFACDYFCLSYLDHNAFHGLDFSINYFFQFFNLLYYSVVTFATVGYGDIFPISLPAKGLVMFEVLSYIFFILILLANFMTIRDELHKNNDYPFGNSNLGS